MNGQVSRSEIDVNSVEADHCRMSARHAVPTPQNLSERLNGQTMSFVPIGFLESRRTRLPYEPLKDFDGYRTDQRCKSEICDSCGPCKDEENRRNDGYDFCASHDADIAFSS
jgi:hypothetical protein